MFNKRLEYVKRLDPIVRVPDLQAVRPDKIRESRD